MKKHLHNFFIPHEGNEFRPHSLRGESVLMFGTVTVLLFAGALLNTYLITRTNFFAAIIPEVLADYANGDRVSLSVPRLRWNETLAVAAREKAEDMAQKGYFAHTSPEGVTPWYWFKKAGYRYRYAGENLAVYFSDTVDVHNAWMNSSGHRANIVNGRFTEIGIATARGVYEGRETVFVVELFGKPQEAPAPAPEPKPAPAAPKKEPVPILLSEEPEPSVVAGSEIGNELFVAVKDGREEEEDSASVPADQKSANEWSLTSIAERAIASPHANLRLSYLALFAIIAFALFVGVFGEVRRHHPLHSLYGASLIALLTILYYAGEAYVFSRVLIT